MYEHEAITMDPLAIARRTGVWIVAAALWLYAGVAVLFGLFLTAMPTGWVVGLPLVLGGCLVAGGTGLVRARRRALAAVLLVLGGILVGGVLGVFTAAWEDDDPGVLLAGFAVGAAFLGWLPILAGLGLLASRVAARVSGRRRERPT